jgi:hypothetical protein
VIESNLKAFLTAFSLNSVDGYPGIYSLNEVYEIRKKVPIVKKDKIKVEIIMTLNLDNLKKNCSSKVSSFRTTNLYLLKSFLIRI